MRNKIKLIKSLAPNMCFGLILTMLKHPLLIIPTVSATLKSIKITEEKFKESHNTNRIPNAYKHALWNMLIAKKSSWILSQPKAIKWAETITSLHENCVINKTFEQTMDLHNNRVGRIFYQELIKNDNITEEELANYLFEKAQQAIVITESKFFNNYPFDLVYGL